jgi:cob(I)alamin adenosyltransferase
MKIYTKTGDSGTTSLFGGKRLGKDDMRIESYGTIDELNSFIGLVLSHLADEDQRSILLTVQNRLFDMGSVLACDPEKPLLNSDIQESDIVLLENAMDNMESSLEPLKNFILPGGSVAISFTHICRTVCRRAERRVISLSRESEVDPMIIKYLNRLSDYFFVLSRYIALKTGVQEILWVPR